MRQYRQHVVLRLWSRHNLLIQARCWSICNILILYQAIAYPRVVRMTMAPHQVWVAKSPPNAWECSAFKATRSSSRLGCERSVRSTSFGVDNIVGDAAGECSFGFVDFAFGFTTPPSASFLIHSILYSISSTQHYMILELAIQRRRNYLIVSSLI